MPVAAAVGGGLFSGISSIFSGNEQANASKYAANLQAQEAQNSLNFQEQEWGTQQANEAPFLQAGQGAIGNLSQMVNEGNAGTGPLAPWTGTFTAPTAAEAEATPGYQFALKQGELGVQDSAFASGGGLAGGTGKALTNYAEGLASENYQNTFNNALTQYQTAYNTFQNNAANAYNREAGIAGIGQTTAGQLGSQGQAAAGNIGNINMTAGAQQGADIQNAAFQNASGYVGAANAFNGAANNVSSLAMLQQILNGQGGGGAGTSTYGPSQGYGVPTPPGYGNPNIDPSTGQPYGE